MRCRYATVPAENLHLVPESVTDGEACFVEPLAAACRIVEQQVRPGLAPPGQRCSAAPIHSSHISLHVCHAARLPSIMSSCMHGLSV